MAKEKPCDTCTRVKDPRNCENKECKECKVWRMWFLKAWEGSASRLSGIVVQPPPEPDPPADIRRCDYCGGVLPMRGRPNMRYCGNTCSVAAHRERRRAKLKERKEVKE